MAVANITAPARGVAIGTSATTLYTVPTGKVFVIKRVTVNNSTGSAATLSFGTSAGTAYNLITSNSFAANASATIPQIEGHVFIAGEVLQASASAAATLTIARISGLLSDA